MEASYECPGAASVHQQVAKGLLRPLLEFLLTEEPASRKAAGDLLKRILHTTQTTGAPHM